MNIVIFVTQPHKCVASHQVYVVVKLNLGRPTFLPIHFGPTCFHPILT